MEIVKNIWNNKVLITVIIAVVATTLSIQNLVFYLKPNITFFVFLAISPFVFSIRKNELKIRYAWGSLFFIVLYFFLKMQLLFFLSFSAFILFIIESNMGKVNALPLFIILLISPYSSFIFNVFGFPARLLLTEMATYMLSFGFENVATSGNNILINHQSFSVDPECMGLKMVGYGYASTLLFINALEQKYTRKLSGIKILSILVLSTLFIVLVNLFRIVIIVMLQAYPDTISHELIGLLAFGMYFLLPMFLITKKMVLSSPNKTEYTGITVNLNNALVVGFTLVLIGLFTYINLNRSNYRNIEVDRKSPHVSLSGFDKTITPHNVIKFENNQALIYVKPSCSFFAPDHNPTICWRGSGYEFININTKTVGPFEIYTAELKKGKEVLQTAWWFDNGMDKTISQLDWRWKTAKGNEPYRLINITSVSKEALNQQIDLLIYKNLFSNEMAIAE